MADSIPCVIRVLVIAMSYCYHDKWKKYAAASISIGINWKSRTVAVTEGMDFQILIKYIFGRI